MRISPESMPAERILIHNNCKETVEAIANRLDPTFGSSSLQVAVETPSDSQQVEHHLYLVSLI